MNCSSFSHKHGGFQFPRRLSHLDERRRSHEQRFSALARRAAYGFAVCGWRRRSRRLMPPRLFRGGAARRVSGGSSAGVPFYTSPICRSAKDAAFRRRFRGKRGLRKPQRPPTRGRGSREAADKPLQEAGAFELLFFFAQTRRLSISSPPLPPRRTPPFPRAAF